MFRSILKRPWAFAAIAVLPYALGTNCTIELPYDDYFVDIYLDDDYYDDHDDWYDDDYYDDHDFFDWFD
jgi:hypothetical protein